jgi:DNA-binding MarR family transcriptional regulator
MPDARYPYSPDVIEMVQRLFRLKGRFRIGIPENLSNLKKRIQETNRAGKAGGVDDFDTFYNIGIIFSRHDGPISMGELSHDLDIPLSSATRMMDWFVTNGYAQRLPDSQDRRIVRVELTQDGQEIYRTIHNHIMQSIERIMGQLSPEERGTFQSLLRKVLDAFEQENQTDA